MPTDVSPVFPLPNVVFFPDTDLPLHIFEPRYQEMLRDVTSGDGIIAMALLRTGWEDSYEGSPDIHSVGTIGRVENVEVLEDGRSNLRVVGLERVAFEEIPSDRPYRLVRWHGLPERPVNDDDPEIRAAKVSLLASFGFLQRAISGETLPSIAIDERTSFVRAVNQCCALLPVEPILRQQLLEENDIFERQRQLSDWLQQVLERVARLKPFHDATTSN